MDLTKFKKYPSQISATFKRFPIACAFAFFTFFIIVFLCEIHPSFLEDAVKSLIWLSIYPVAAMLIATATTLFQESRKSTSNAPQIITSSTWLVISATLVAIFFREDEIHLFYFTSSIILFYLVAALSIFFAPFWGQKDENGFWNFLQKNIKALITAIIISAILLGAVEGLVLGFSGLFNIDFDENIYFYILLFCSCTVLPILYFTGIPSIDDCLEEVPSLNKFATSTIRFLFIPVIIIGLLLFYAYIVKFALFWYMPEGTVSAFVFGFMIYMFVLVIAMHPARLATEPTIEKRLLKILPAACIPLVFLMSIDISNALIDSDISEEYFYIIAVNIYFYVIIAILLADKVKCKFRYLAIIFCAMYFVLLSSPFSAKNITHYIWMSSIKNALIERGYHEFPLSKEDCESFYKELEHKKDFQAKRVLKRIRELSSNNKSELALLFSAEYDINSRIRTAEQTVETKYDIEATIDHSDSKIFEVPQKVKTFARIQKSLDEEDYEFRNDTLFFQISPQDSNDTYDFAVPKQILEDSTTTLIEGQGAKLRIEELYVSIGTEGEQKFEHLRIEGYLFME